MNINTPYLIIEINDQKIILLAIKYNENFDYEILDTIMTNSQGVEKGKIIDVNISSSIIKKNLNQLEKKIDYIFKNAIIICDQDNYDCINISGYKKLRGSQILNDDVLFILNNIKKIIINNNQKKSLVHIFNSNFLLDHKEAKNMPIGLYGDFYNQHHSFFLLPKNDIKNINLVANKSDINVEKIILKNFTKGVSIIKKNNIQDKFILINLKKTSSNISIFDKSSFIYSENFNFGSNMIIQDIKKLCSLEHNEVINVFKEVKLDDLSNNKDKYLEEKIFISSTFRKISIDHINDIISARVKELAELIFTKNINIKNLVNDNTALFLSLEDTDIINSLRKNINKIFSNDGNIRLIDYDNDTYLDSALTTAELIGKGWEKEAIPLIQTKKTLIARIFSSLFN